MTQANVIEMVLPRERLARLRIADLLSKGIFGSLLFLVVVVAVPYGTVEPWWRAAFVCVVFVLAIIGIVERLLSGLSAIEGAQILAPMLALSLFALLQTFSLQRGETWSSISADPYETRFFVLQLLALTLALALLYRYASIPSRIRILIYVVLSVAVASAIYGILRQTMQRSTGFVLPLVKPNQGYGQFINKNHFAFLMEMALGLGLGFIVSGGVKRERVLMFVGMLMPIWTALVLSNSRGGVLAMFSQVIVGTLLLTRVGSINNDSVESSRFSKLTRSMAVRLGLVGILTAALLSGVLWVGGDRLLGSFESVSRELDPTASGLNEGATRRDIWHATGKMFLAHPMVGVGLGGYWIAITSYHQASGTLTPQQAHNEYLELLSSGGVIGFALGVWFIAVLFRNIREQLNSQNRFRGAVCFGATLGITGVAVHSLVDFGLHLLANALIFIVLVMMATTTNSAEQNI